MKLTKGKDQGGLKPKFPKITIDKSKHHYAIFTDGACSKDKSGGYAFVVVEDDSVVYEYNRSLPVTTNNIAEMSAILDALAWVEDNAYDSQVLIHTDSQYCLHSITTWYKGYIARNWKDVKNAELWKQILKMKERLSNVEYKWVRAHQTDDSFETKWNNYVDKLAVFAATGTRVEDKVTRVTSNKRENYIATNSTKTIIVPVQQEDTNGLKHTGIYLNEVTFINNLPVISKSSQAIKNDEDRYTSTADKLENVIKDLLEAEKLLNQILAELDSPLVGTRWIREVITKYLKRKL